MTGELLEVAKDMETRMWREPLGIVAAICPFSMCAECVKIGYFCETNTMQTSRQCTLLQN